MTRNGIRLVMLGGLGILAILSGCSSAPKAPPAAADNAQATVDAQILAAAEKVQRAQADLFQAAALDASVQAPPADVKDDAHRVTLSWKGDAGELLRQLAQARGLEFVSTGMRLPLPISLAVKDEPFQGVLQLLRAQIGYRAVLKQQGDKLTLEYARPQL